MIYINLLPQELRKKETPRIVLPEIPIKKTLGIAAGALIGSQVLFSLVAVWLTSQVSMTQREIVVLKEKTSSLQELKAKTAGIQSRLKEFRDATIRNFYWASLLNALSGSVTKGVWLRSFVVETQQLEVPKDISSPLPAKSRVVMQTVKLLKLEGSVLATGQETAYIGKFLQSLKENPVFNDLFGDIQLSNINQRKIKEFDVYDFMIVCKFKKGEL